MMTTVYICVNNEVAFKPRFETFAADLTFELIFCLNSTNILSRQICPLTVMISTSAAAASDCMQHVLWLQAWRPLAADISRTLLQPCYKLISLKLETVCCLHWHSGV